MADKKEGKLKALINRITVFVTKDIWSFELYQKGPLRRAVANVVKVVVIAVRTFLDDKVMTKAAALTYSTLFAIVVAGGCYFLGGFGRLFSDQIDIAANGFDSVVPTMLSGLPDLLIGVVVILVLSASMSTLSSLVLTSSSTITLDLIRGHVFKKMEEKKQLLIMRWLIVLFIVISVIIALVQYKSNVTFIAQLMGISWGAMAGAFLAPFLYGLYWKKTSGFACWTSFFFSVVFMLVDLFARPILPAPLQSPINAGAFCMLAGLVIVPVVSMITPKPEEALVEDAFSSYSKKVLVQQTEALSDEEEN